MKKTSSAKWLSKPRFSSHLVILVAVIASAVALSLWLDQLRPFRYMLAVGLALANFELAATIDLLEQGNKLPSRLGMNLWVTMAVIATLPAAATLWMLPDQHLFVLLTIVFANNAGIYLFARPVHRPSQPPHRAAKPEQPQARPSAIKQFLSVIARSGLIGFLAGILVLFALQHLSNWTAFTAFATASLASIGAYLLERAHRRIGYANFGISACLFMPEYRYWTWLIDGGEFKTGYADLLGALFFTLLFVWPFYLLI